MVLSAEPRYKIGGLLTYQSVMESKARGEVNLWHPCLLVAHNRKVLWVAFHEKCTASSFWISICMQILHMGICQVNSGVQWGISRHKHRNKGKQTSMSFLGENLTQSIDKLEDYHNFLLQLISIVLLSFDQNKWRLTIAVFSLALCWLRIPRMPSQDGCRCADYYENCQSKPSGRHQVVES